MGSGRARAGVLAGAALFALAWWRVRTFVADDTFIHLTYAKHVRDGHGLVFNLGERVYGTTSPLWSLALAWLGSTGIDLLLLARILSTGFGLLTVGLGSLALRRLLDAGRERGLLEPRIADLAWLAGTLAWAADVWMARWSASGMESSLGAFLVLLGFTSLIGARGAVPRGAAVGWAVAALIRPEASLLLGLLALRAVLEEGPLAARVRALAAALVPAILLGGAWLAYAEWFYGTVVPVTFASKAAEQTPFLHNLSIQAQEVGASRGVEALALLIGLPWLVRQVVPEWRTHLVPLVWLVVLPLFYCATHVLGITRYLLLATPVLACYGWLALAHLASAAARRGAFAPARAGLVAACVMAVAANGFVLERWVAPQARAFDRIIHETLIPEARWFHDFTPPSAQVAIQHVGVFGYYAERRIVDLSGLVTPQLTSMLAEHQYDRVVTEFLFAARARPDYVIDVVNEPRRLLRASPYAECLTLLDERPYDYRGIRLPEPGWLTVYRVDWSCYDAKARGPS